MLINIFITLALLLLSFFGLQRLFTLPKNVWLLFLVQPLVMAASPVIVFIGGILATSMGADPALVTLPVTMMILGVASGAIPAALLAKNKGRRFATFTGFTLGFSGTLVAMFAALNAHFELLILASFLLGISTAFTQQLRFAAIESVSNSNEVPTVLSILMLSGIFSAFLGPEIAVTAKDWLSSPHGYAGSFLFLSGLFLLAMLLMLNFTNPEVTTSDNQGEARPLSEIIKQPIFIIAMLSAAIGFALMSYLMTATPLSMHKLHGHSLNDTKWVIQSHIAAMFIPSLFTALLVKRIGLKNLMLTGTIIYAVVTVIALSGEQVMHYWWALILLGIGWNFLFLTGTSLLPQSYQASERHKVQAINDFIIFGFQAIASLMAGWILFKAGWHVVVLTGLPFIVILFVVSWFYFKKEREKINKTSAATDTALNAEQKREVSS
ncbi:MFS transporter [Colwellia sp. MB02u-18]|uniref:MFS transporter n=1 Tax=unclassified Colwellia TaxID=196834 RepID=UPI0015F63EDC|nr:MULTISPECIES: MFS transporter [unclassified Colwellia]MBA6225505.1 MFS transporter [Colwellia sp. MB3u-45]MBA6266398.1 MFS transporter [Colwellia sp. MB3u-43]MBA6320686.1 MFS transporter [Colwellia sp. MB02u-19]MBA6325508.1 MFS transporter [Colwellia sp. MB02u-18]MBA6331983.1 MFS transporter [Colwellia sp. MB02u-12]